MITGTGVHDRPDSAFTINRIAQATDGQGENRSNRLLKKPLPDAGCI
jgi:hypothetical protein